MGQYLNFGAGPNQLPEPWQNLNAEHDIRKRLKFEDASASGILAEHVIEHVPFLQGFGFLLECVRVLEPGGVLRLAFPDAGRFVSPGPSDFYEDRLNDRLQEYALALQLRPGGEPVRRSKSADEKKRAALVLLLTGWHHQSTWSDGSAAAVLFAVGFSAVRHCEYGAGDLSGVDGHHKDVGHEIALLETSILEATK
jgi:hypothetical protein